MLYEVITQFLAIAAQSDALLHVVDASGGIDSTGQISQAGTGDPVSDFADIEEELIMWYLKILEGNRDKVSSRITSYNVCYTKLLREAMLENILEIQKELQEILKVQTSMISGQKTTKKRPIHKTKSKK